MPHAGASPRRPRARRVRSPGAVVVAGLVLGACSSAGLPPSGSTTSSTGHQGSTTTQPPATTIPTPGAPTSGPLSVSTPIAVPLSADQVAATEGPDGAVFLAPQSPTSTAPAVVWVVDGNGPAAVAEHTASGVAALAADSNNLYVATYSSVTSYDRNTGNQNGQWPLPEAPTGASGSDLVAMAAAGGGVLVAVTEGATQRVYRIKPGSTRPAQFVTAGSSVVFGPDGSVYDEGSDGHLAVRRASGSTVVGPRLANQPNGLGGGVQYLQVVAGGLLWVSEPAGQGLDARYSLYDASSLRQVGTFEGTTSQQIARTGAGTLALEFPAGDPQCDSSNTALSCVARISDKGTLGDAVAVGSGFVLLGPYPAVVADDPTNTALVVERIT